MQLDTNLFLLELSYKQLFLFQLESGKIKRKITCDVTFYLTSIFSKNLFQNLKVKRAAFLVECRTASMIMMYHSAKALPVVVGCDQSLK